MLFGILAIDPYLDLHILAIDPYLDLLIINFSCVIFRF